MISTSVREVSGSKKTRSVTAWPMSLEVVNNESGRQTSQISKFQNKICNAIKYFTISKTKENETELDPEPLKHMHLHFSTTTGLLNLSLTSTFSHQMQSVHFCLQMHHCCKFGEIPPSDL